MTRWRTGTVTNVLLQWSVEEVLIGEIGALKESVVVVESDVQGDREADCRPQTVTTADPVPEFEHVRRVNAKIGDFWSVRR